MPKSKTANFPEGISTFHIIRNNKNLIQDFLWANYVSFSGDKKNAEYHGSLKKLNMDLFRTLKEAIEKEEPLSFEYEISENGNVVWLQINAAIKNGEFIVCCSDITKLKEKEQKQDQLEAELVHLKTERAHIRTEEFSRQQELFRLIADSIPVLVAYIDKNFYFRFINKAHYDWFGPEIEKNLGKRFDEIVAIFGQKNSMELFIKSLSGSGEFYEHEIIDLKGNVLYLKSTLIPDLDENGEVLGYISVSIDISKEKKAQQKADLVKKRMLTILNNVPVLFWAVNKNGILTVSEGKALEGLGQKPGEQTGHSVYELYKDFPDVLNNIRRALQGEEFNVSMNVSHLHLQSFYTPIRNTEGEITGAAGISTDISDRVKAEKALSESEARYKAMTEGLPLMVWTALPNGEVNYYNKKWAEYTGLIKGEGLEQGWHQVVHPNDLSESLEKWGQSIRTGKGFKNEVRFRRAKDRTFRWHLVRAWPAKSTDGTILNWVGTCTDIHDQKIQNEELNIKNKELIRTNNDLDNFIYTASHDLRSPISNMEGLISAIEGVLDETCEQEIGAMIKMADASVHRLRNTINELTEISQVQKNIDPNIQTIRISDIVDDFIADHRDEISRSNTSIKTELNEEYITFSRKNFRTIIYNLLSNAIKYRHSERDPIVKVKTELTNDNYLLLSVRDNGLGFDEKNTDKIFGMFRRLHSHVEGTGVGLYIVKRVLQNAGGKIEVSSTPGEGTLFRLYFPMPLHQ
ncbi:PAS domain-containing sensor histidine kinase [Cytophagaceae bacterium ABcell3]|nr:PAS domain-containing sensor histidine kinase [Cytophagaceae bacterium ABcell3]